VSVKCKAKIIDLVLIKWVGCVVYCETLNEAFLEFRNDVMMLIIHAGVEWRMSSCNNFGCKTDPKASVQSMEIMDVACLFVSVL
jgi:hypothetical protein